MNRLNFVALAAMRPSKRETAGTDAVKETPRRAREVTRCIFAF